MRHVSEGGRGCIGCATLTVVGWLVVAMMVYRGGEMAGWWR